MVLEDSAALVSKRKIYSLLLGILYVFISYGTAKVFFPSLISMAMIFFITLLLVPSTSRLISAEERIERKQGIRHFFRHHAALMEIFFFFFIGIFIGYLILGNAYTDSLTYQADFLEKQGLQGNFVEQTIPAGEQFSNIVLNNTSVIVIAFMLSLFYGVGALFLIVLNASIFAGFALIVGKTLATQALMTTGILSLHILVEVFGFLLAAIAGGVISKALVREKTGTLPFRNVIKDGSILLALSIAVIILSAVIEVFVTPQLIGPFLQ